jgi:hypothetical protein
MKKSILFVPTMIATVSSFAQQIDSLVFVPANPTTTDTVIMYVYGTYPNSSCTGTATAVVSGTTITGVAFHCQGMLTAICNDVDTVQLGVLAAGTYTVNVSLSAGFGTFPNCSPPIVPNDNIQTTLTVLTPTGIATPARPVFSLAPNPSSGEFIITDEFIQQDDELLMYSVDGRLVKRFSLQTSRTVINATLSSGIYFVVLRHGDLQSEPQKLIISQ